MPQVEGINQNLYYRWSKDFLEAGKKRLAGDTAREATSDEVKEIQAQARQLKELVAELMIENRLLKKAYSAMGSPIHEVQRRREAGDHWAGRAVVVTGAAGPGPAGHPALQALEDGQPAPRCVWNKIPEPVAEAVSAPIEFCPTTSKKSPK
jgi:transposase